MRLKDWLKGFTSKLNLESRIGEGYIQKREENVDRIFFATDIHGSTICWKKFINTNKFFNANILILGGDTTGKAIIPIVEEGESFSLQEPNGKKIIVKDKNELYKRMEYLSNYGYYPYITNKEEYKELESSKEKLNGLFIRLMKERIKEWIRLAEERLNGKEVFCYVCPGNDDPFEIDEAWKSSSIINVTEGKVVKINKIYEMVSTGWTNPTPWRTHRETTEEKLEVIIDHMVNKVRDMNTTIFNIHVPPYNSGLDEAPELDENLKPKYGGRSFVPVGSKAVRKAIEKYQPLLSLHGHVHESMGERKIGRTIAVNPGSSYMEGWLQGVIIDIDERGIKRRVFITG
ncbi:MAG: hypothetical protein QXX95_04555 [Nitrososphaerales archaeon]